MSSSSSSARSRKRNSVTAVLPPSVAWLEQLSLGMKVVDAPTTNKSLSHRYSAKGGLHYKLTMQQQRQSFVSSSSTAEWALNRSFDDYRAFQKRLLKLMSHGHFCNAECPWLYTFVKSYFPKKSFFGSNSTCLRLGERRREALLRIFSTLQMFLLNRNNHGCQVVVDGVATELLQFLLQDAGKDHPLKRQLSFDGFSVNSGGRFSSEESVTSTSDEEETGSSTDFESLMCTLCDCSLDVEPHSCEQQTAAAAGVTSLPSFQSSSSLSYTTTLSCGHQFHDECIVLKLNEVMQCPTCGTKQSSHR